MFGRDPALTLRTLLAVELRDLAPRPAPPGPNVTIWCPGMEAVRFAQLIQFTHSWVTTYEVAGGFGVSVAAALGGGEGGGREVASNLTHQATGAAHAHYISHQV